MLRSLVFLINLFLLVGTACAQSAQMHPDILWKDAEHSRARFLPSSVLATTTIDELPLGDREASSLRAQMNLYEAANSEPKEFSRISTGCTGKTAPITRPVSAPSLPEIVRNGTTVLAGRVTRTAMGWDSSRLQVAEAAFIDVDEAIGGKAATLHPVAVLSRGGTLRLPVGTVCSAGVGGRYLPKTGDRVLAVGHHWPFDDRLFLHDYVFPIHDGVVQPREDLRVAPSSFRLTDLRAAIEGALSPLQLLEGSLDM